MKLTDLENLNLRCACGDPITIKTSDDHAVGGVIISFRVHDKRYDQRISHYALIDSQYSVGNALLECARIGERELQRACPCEAPMAFGEVVTNDWTQITYTLPDGTRQQRMARRERQQVSTPPVAPVPAPRPVISPAFGRPIARRIVK